MKTKLIIGVVVAIIITLLIIIIPEYLKYKIIGSNFEIVRKQECVDGEPNFCFNKEAVSDHTVQFITCDTNKNVSFDSMNSGYFVGYHELFYQIEGNQLLILTDAKLKGKNILKCGLEIIVQEITYSDLRKLRETYKGRGLRAVNYK